MKSRNDSVNTKPLLRGEFSEIITAFPGTIFLSTLLIPETIAIMIPRNYFQSHQQM